MTSVNNRLPAEEIFDLSEALKRVEGDMDLFKEIVDLFLEDYPTQVRGIEEGITRRDSHIVERAAHSLKGSVANFAAKRARETAYRLEVMGKEGRLEEAEEALADLKRELKDLEDALRAVGQVKS